LSARATATEGRAGIALPLVLITLGVGLRLWQWLARPSLWLDELVVARNVLEKPLAALLLRPLDHDQIAPPLYLLLTRGCVELFGPDERAFRLPALVASLATLLLVWRLGRRLVPRGAALVALGLAAAAPSLVFFGTQVKPYAVDVAAVLGLLLLSLRFAERPPSTRAALAAGGAGVVLALLSSSAVLALAGLGAALVLLAARRRRIDAPLLLLALLWAAAAIGSTWLSLRRITPSTAGYFRTVWEIGFMPLAPRAPVWLAGRLVALFRDPFLGFPLAPLHAVLAAAGFVSIAARRRGVALLLGAPFAAHLAAAAAQRYPFEGRLVLYALPLFLLLEAEGAALVARGVARRGGPWPIAALPLLGLALSGAAVLARRPPVYSVEEMRPLLETLASRVSPGDAIYATYGAGQAMAFYGPRNGFAPGTYVLGGCHRPEPRGYLRELDAFRGRSRVWIVLTHSLPGLKETALFTGYLSAIGMRHERIPAGPGTFAALYDLSDPTRLSSTSAETYPVSVPETRLGCAAGPQTNKGLETRGPVSP